MPTLTQQQAYLAMFLFLEAEYSLAPSDETGGLLGSMSLLPDGSPADAAVEKQWADAVTAAVGGQVSAALTVIR